MLEVAFAIKRTSFLSRAYLVSFCIISLFEKHILQISLLHINILKVISEVNTVNVRLLRVYYLSS